MRHWYLYIILLTATVLSSCRRDSLPLQNTGSLSLLILSGNKQNSDSGILKRITIYLFSSTGESYMVYALSDRELSMGKTTIQNIKPGTYHAYTLANGPAPAGISDEEEFLSLPLPLGQYNSQENGFVMGSGRTSVTICPEEVTSLSVTLKRYVSRIKLMEIRNESPSGSDPMTINYAMLTNVVGMQTVSGSDKPLGWLNVQGVADEPVRDASHIIGTGGYVPSCPDLTFSEYAATIRPGEVFSPADSFFGYANSCAVRPSGFTPDFSGEKSVLAVSVSVGGGTWYYPVVISGGMAPNTTYDVILTITQKGSPDPDNPMSIGRFQSVVNTSEREICPEYD